MTRWRYAAATDIGLVRETNQDAYFVDDRLALVADGMGGHAAGEVASALTVDFIDEGFHARPTVEGLYRSIEAANRAIIADGVAHPEHFGMGTTVIAVGLTEDEGGAASPTLFHVGDSRAYQLRDGALRQLSDDHSVAEEWVKMGRLTPEEAAVHPRRHQLTRALGVEDSLEIDVISLNVMPGDRVLLCSDGLTNELTEAQVAALASPPLSLDEAVEQLVAAARQAGGHDNISVVLLEFDEVTPASEPIRKTVTAAPPPIAPTARSRVAHPARRHRFTWRIWVAALVVALVGVGFVGVMHWYMYSTYYLAPDGAVVGVYQGQPNGVLWYKPVLMLPTTVEMAQLTPAGQRLVAATIVESTAENALQEATFLHTQWQDAQPATPTTTTTVAG